MPRTRTSFAKGNPTAFKPGQTGNPTGRKPTVEGIQALARSHCPEAIQALVDALKDPDRAVPAAIALLDRGIGKPAIAVWAQVDSNVFVGGIDAPPRETFEQWTERRRRELNALDGPPQKHAPQESREEWLARYRRDQQVLDGPRPEHVQPPASPNGEAAAPAVQPPSLTQGERAAERTAAQPRAFGSNAANSAADSAGPSTRSMTEQERDWLAIRRRELGLLPDDIHPNPVWKR